MKAWTKAVAVDIENENRKQMYLGSRRRRPKHVEIK
jgi:hypothetical protein